MVILQVHILVFTGTFSGSFTGSPFGSNRIQNGTFADLLWIRKMSTMVSFVDPQNGSNWTFSGSIQRSLNGFTHIKIDYFHYNPVAAKACRSPSLNIVTHSSVSIGSDQFGLHALGANGRLRQHQIYVCCVIYIWKRKEKIQIVLQGQLIAWQRRNLSLSRQLVQKSVLYRSPFVGGVSDIQLI